MMKNNLQNIDTERRSGVDRRYMTVNFGYPFIDSEGFLVTEDRRKEERRSAASQEMAYQQKTFSTQTA